MFIACIAMLFSACHKDGVYNPSKKISKIYYSENGYKNLGEVWSWNKNNTLDKIDYYSDGRIAYTHNFSYEKKRLIRMNNYASNESVEYKYDNKGLKEANYYRGGTLIDTYTFTHQNGKITKIIETWLGNNYYDKGNDRFDMNPLQFILPDEIATSAFEASKKIKKNSKGTSTYEYALTWEKNNITKMVYTSYEGGYTYSYEAQYDKKKNPFYGAYLNIYFEENVPYQSKNNITQIAYTETYEGQTYRYEYTYEYNYDGQWPVSKRQVNTEGDSYLTEYEYTK